MHKLYFDNGSLKGRTVELVEKKVILGRGTECQIQLVDEGVSRQHCYIEERGDGVYLCDMGSTNGVFVDGNKITNHKLSTGEYIKVGSAGASFDAPSKKAEVPAKETATAPRPQEIKPTPVPRQPAMMPSSPPPEAGFLWQTYVAIGAGVLSVLLFFWALTLQRQVSELKRQVEVRPGTPVAVPNVVTGRDASVEKLKQEVEDLKQQLQKLQQAGPQSRRAVPATPPVAAVEEKGKRIATAELPRRVRILQIERDEQPLDESADERISLGIKVKPQLSAEIEQKEISVEVVCYEQAKTGQVTASTVSPKKLLQPETPWKDFTPQRLSTSYIVPKGYRVKERSETGQERSFYGFVVRAYYKNELQDEAVRPFDFPKGLLSQEGSNPSKN